MVKPAAPFPPDVTAPGVPGETWYLILSPKPSAALRQYFAIPAEANGGVRVEKYSSRFGADFEKHIDAKGIVTWWRLMKVAS